MNNIKLAESNIKQAEERIKHAEEALKSGNYPYVVRQSQEAVELLLKAALRIIGIEPPKWHDVGPILRRESDNFPSWFKEKIDILASISRSLRKEREFSMYSDEETGIPPEELYTYIDGEDALGKAKKTLDLVTRLFTEVLKKT